MAIGGVAAAAAAVVVADEQGQGVGGTLGDARAFKRKWFL